MYFHFRNHDVASIIVSENENARFWSAGRGDLLTKGDFNQFVRELEKARGHAEQEDGDAE